MNLDPAAFVLVPSGLIYILAAWITRRWPPPVNRLYGYRTKASMVGPERWDLAQRVATWEMIRAGVFLVLLGLVLWVGPLAVPELIGIGIALAAIVGSCIWLYVATERALRDRFEHPD